MLPNDVARCRGVFVAEPGLTELIWREGCEDCQRRTATQPHERFVQMEPPALILFECEYRIPGGEE